MAPLPGGQSPAGDEEHTISDDNLKDFYVQGLQALHSAGEKGREGAQEALSAATSPELRQMVQQGTELAQRHADKVDGLLRQAGGQPNGRPNAVMEGIQSAAREIRQAAKDEATRDAGIIDSGQIALHYYVAAFGSLAAHAKTLGMGEAAATLKGMVEESKQMDQRYTELAERKVNPQAKAA